jgi:hypothetical protein
LDAGQDDMRAGRQVPIAAGRWGRVGGARAWRPARKINARHCAKVAMHLREVG